MIMEMNKIVINIINTVTNINDLIAYNTVKCKTKTF